MRILSGGREATYVLFCALCYALVEETQSFVKVSTPRVLPICTARHRCRTAVVCLGATPPGKRTNGGGGGAAAAEEGGGGPFARTDDRTTRIRKAPLRITPNFQPHHKRRPKTDAIRDITNGAFLTEQSFDMVAMAWAEFSDWSRRTVNRNIAGVPFEFDIRQWCSSTRKWWSRMVEMDVQAKADFFRLYEQGIQERDTWGNQAAIVDSRVEDEWDNIYVECQDCYSSSNSDGSAGNGLRKGSDGKAKQGAAAPAAAAAYYSSSGKGRQAKAVQGPRFSSALELDFGEIFDGEEEEEEEDEGVSDDGEGEGDDDDEEIIDCAIRGKWYFQDNDDQPHFSPQ